jgi:hypothetical protein
MIIALLLSIFPAPPSFIVRLPPYTGAMAEAENFSVSCQVECSPRCGIVWLKDGVQIDDDDDRFSIVSEGKVPNYAKNDFESIASTLTWNVGNWPGGKLDRIIDNANYTCQSTSNAAGEGVASTTYFRVECEYFGVTGVRRHDELYLPFRSP